jgi:hypothetical protein
MANIQKFVQPVQTEDGKQSLYETLTYLPERLFRGNIAALRAKVEEIFYQKLRSDISLVGTPNMKF